MRVALILLLLAVSCGGEGPLPIARIDLSPATLCEGDSDQSVTVSARRSAGSDGTAENLSYSWGFSTPPLEITSGGLAEREIIVRFAAVHPVGVRLVVEQLGGRSASRESLLSLTRTTLVPCTAGCAVHETCTRVGGVEVCVDDSTCSGDDECGCLSCRTDDAGTPHCLP